MKRLLQFIFVLLAAGSITQTVARAIEAKTVDSKQKAASEKADKSSKDKHTKSESEPGI